VTPATVPDVPGSLAVQRGNGSAELAFDAPADNGSTIVAYEVSTDAGATWLRLETTGATHLAATLGGLANGITYDIEVRAVNDVGGGAAAGPWSMMPAAVPGIPTDVTVVRDHGTAMLTFTAPFDSGGSAVTGFVITISPGGATVSCQASPCLISGLASGVAYTFSVRATNAVGGGIESPTARVPAQSRSFRIQVYYRVPGVCAPRCTAHAEIRTRSGRRLYTVPLPGDGQVVLGTRTSLRLTGGTNARFSITIDRAKLLRAPVTTIPRTLVAGS